MPLPFHDVTRLGRITEPRRSSRGSSPWGEGAWLRSWSHGRVGDSPHPIPGQHTLIVGAYDRREDAERALEEITALGAGGQLDVIGASIVTRDADGHIELPEPAPVEGHKGVRVGAVAGLALGAVFPPSLLAGATVGAVGGLFKDRHDKSLRHVSDAVANTLPPSSAGVIAVMPWAMMDDLDRVLSSSRRVTKSALDDHSVRRLCGDQQPAS